MRTRRLVLIACICLTLMAYGEEEKLSATEIVRLCDDLLRGEKSYCTMTMTVTRPRWTRTVTMEAWTEGADNVLIRILSPKKEKGVAFLKKGREGWQYIPAIDRVMKLSPSMMLQSWMGSDFTNDDVVRADSIIVDYTHKVLSEPKEDEVEYWLVQATPKPDAAVVWGKIVFKVRKSNFVADRVDFYDEDGELVKYYETSDIKKIEGKEIATKFTMYNVIEEGHKTAMTYDHITFKPKMKPGTFSRKNLRRQ